MFKIESYVTPILLSYVDKYVRDFKPADAQVSLWGGGVALHNLVLKADVLQQEVALPFTLVSGRIHELLIHVPWTKIMSEPIIVTIDTIECVLSLNPPASPDESPPPESPSRKSHVVEAPPGYMQALVRRIVSNIALRVHHLIVKYVQDDIVMSLNVKHLAVDSAGANWEPAFADIDQYQPVIRRLMRLDDFTLCLDKTDSDGKIRFYQEPLLYRCQLDLRVLTRLVSANTRRASSLSVQLRSSKLAWGVTSDQLTLLLRLVRERTSIDLKSTSPAPKISNATQSAPLHTTSSNSAEPARNESWSDWAWSWLPTWMDREGGAEEAPMPATPTPVYFTAYLDDVSLVFKVMELEGGNRKRARSVLELSASHAAVKSSVCYPTMLRFRVGARALVLSSTGKCVCGHLDSYASNDESTVYLRKMEVDDPEEAWQWPEDQPGEADVETAEAAEEHGSNIDNAAVGESKFGIDTSDQQDPGQPEGPPEAKEPRDDGEEFWATIGPLLLFEYTHDRSPPQPYTNPYENPPKDFEYSDWVEECNLKISLEPVEFKVCMGLIHRLAVLRSLYQDPNPDQAEVPVRVLTVEECEALSDNLPQRRIAVNMRGVRVRIEPWDHSLNERSSRPPVVVDLDLPKTTVIANGPLYPLRVCSAACQMPDDTGPLWQGARLHITTVVTAIQVQICSPAEGHPRPCARFDLRVVAHLLLYKEFFTRESVQLSYSVKIKEANMCGSAARLEAAWHVPMSLMAGRMSLPLRHTTLANDALNDEESVAIDVTLEDLGLRGYLTRNINTHILTLQTAKATALHELKGSEMKQAWLFSAPDAPTTTPYLRLATQWCSQPIPNSLDYVGMWTEPLAICVDPLFIAWLAYKPQMKPYVSEVPSLLGLTRSSSSTQYFMRRRVTPPSSSGRGGSRSGSGAELVHVRPRSVGSSSEPSEKKESNKPSQPAKPADERWSGDRLLRLHQRLRHMLVSVELGLTLLYVTMTTASAIDCETLRDAMERHASASHTVLAVSLGRLSMYSSLITKHLWHDIKHDGPTFITPKPNQNADSENESFPWKMRLADVSCYTLEVHAGTDRKGREKSSSGLRSQLRVPCVATPRTVLELVTTSVTLTVVTKALAIKTVTKPETKKHAENTAEEEEVKYFKAGIDFKPSTLKEFVRGPARRKKQTTDVTESKPGPAQKPVTTVTSGPVVSLGVNIHADTPPVIVRLDHDQVHVMAAAVHCFSHLLALLHRAPIPDPTAGHTSVGGSHRNLIRSVSEMEETQTRSEGTPSDNPSELISIFEAQSAQETKSQLKTFFWFQWVVSRATLVVATYQVKLAFDIDDIISTIDLQTHYNQFKVKLASASVRHYERLGSDEWTAGCLGGRVLEAREPSNAKEENHFLAVTVTQAQISNLPTSWREELNPKLLEQKSGEDSMWEIYATLAPLEAVLEPAVLDNIMSLIKEMMPRSFCPLQAEDELSSGSWQWPLCYVTAGGLRMLITAEENKHADDTFVIVIGKVTVNPFPENPICRRAINPAADGWLTVNGGLDGRQYEILVNNFAARSAQFRQLVHQEASEAEMMKGTVGENPALKWTQPVVSPIITPVLHAVDLSCVLAPALYSNGVLACGPAVELNLVSDCAIELSMDQLKLARSIGAELYEALQSSDALVFDEEKHGVCPYATLLMQQESKHEEPTLSFSDLTLTEEASEIEQSLAADSGVDTVTSQSNIKASGVYVSDPPTKKSVSVGFVDQELEEPSEHLEVFVTMGMIELSLYTADDSSPEVIALRPPRLPEPGERGGTPEPVLQVIIDESVEPSKKKDIESPAGSRSLTDAIRKEDIGKTQLELHVFPHARKCEGNLPLLHVTLHQPNLYYWRKKMQKSLQVSLFNAWVGLGVGQVAQQWHAALLSTAKGVPDPVTDIPPALATMKVMAPSNGVHGTVRLDVERPIMLELCTDRLRRLRGILGLIQNRVSPTLSEEYDAEKQTAPVLYKMKRFLFHHLLENITIQTSQIGVSGSEGTIGWDAASVQIAAGDHPKRLIVRGLLTALMVAAGPPGDHRHLLLQPVMLGLDLHATWEAWRRAEGGLSAREPTVRVNLEMDRVVLDLRPADLAALTRMQQTLADLLGTKAQPPVPVNSTESLYRTRSSGAGVAFRSKTDFDRKLSALSVEMLESSGHYYKDDLRSGAFKILSGGQLPMAYQVTLHKSAVSWRYPHPRAITRLVAFPLPGLDEEVECVLELYSPMLLRWEAHTYFKLPLSEPRELQLYVPPPDAVFAMMWRLRTCSNVENKPPAFEFNVKKFMPKSDPLVMEPQPSVMSGKSSSAVTAEQLSGVLRVDSYFAPSMLPRTKLVVRLVALEVNLHNALPYLSSQVTALEGYYVSRPLMRSHRVLTASARDCTAYAQLGSPAGHLLILDTHIDCDVLDCATGTMEQLIDQFRVQASASFPTEAVSRARACATNVHVALHVPRLRTLHALATDWQLALDQYILESKSTSTIEEPTELIKTKREVAAVTAAVLEGRVSLWIHNSCASALRVGQEGTDEVVPMGSGARLAYRWRNPTAPKKLRLALAGPSTDWHWSNSIPFTAGTYRIRLEDAESLGSSKRTPGGGVYAHVKIEQIGARRCLQLAGRLSLANMLRFDLLYKVRARCLDSNQWQTVCSGELSPETFGRSVICGAECEMVLKIKFAAHDTGWSGDIPVKECPKENVPWLVKVPSTGDTPYMSVWCRVVRARSDGRVLAAVWPLYALRSHLPLDTDVLIMTETGMSSPDLVPEQTRPSPLIQTAPGRGTTSHLLAPGTTAAKHSLSFQYRYVECPVTREAVPLHYGVTDTSVFDKRAPVATIEEVIDEVIIWLQRSGRHSQSLWPYSIVTKHWPGTWQPAKLQPRCDVNVRYEAVRAGGGCCLELQLCPAVLLCNAAPLALTLRAHDAAPLCKVEPGAAISPPSALLKKPFFMSVELGRETFVSSQLAVSGSEPGRYGAPPSGQVTLDHPANFAIQCNHKVALLTLYYEIKEQINVLGVSSTYVLINRLKTDILVSAIAVLSEFDEDVTLNPNTYKVVEPTKEGCIEGTPLCRLWVRGRWRGGCPTELRAYLCVALRAGTGPVRGPVPVRLGCAPVRRAMALHDHDKRSVPIVVTQVKHDGRWLITVAHDPCPQFVVHNRTRMPFAVAQPTRSTDEPSTSYVLATPECEGARWWCVVHPEEVTHYSTPAHCARYPPPPPHHSTPAHTFVPFVTFAKAKDDGAPDWSAPVAVTDGEQLVQLWSLTIKLRVRTHPHSTHLELQDVHQYDISASDIRRRLFGAFSEESFKTQTGDRIQLKRNNLERTDAEERLLDSSMENSSSNQAVLPEPTEDLTAVETSNAQDTSTVVLFCESGNRYQDAEEYSQMKELSPDRSCVFDTNVETDWDENMSLGPCSRFRCTVGGFAVELSAAADARPLVALRLDRVALLLRADHMTTKSILSIADVQIDNLQYDSGQYDFAVVATTRADPLPADRWPPLWNMFAERDAFSTRQDNARVLLKVNQDIWTVLSYKYKAFTEVELRMGPLALYVEDAYVTALVELSRLAFPLSAPSDEAHALMEERSLQAPLRLRTLYIHPLDLTLTLHTAVRMYIALDQSPLRLSAFKLEDMMTSTERLTHALTVHYLSAAILGAGWVVGGLELLGAPGALAARVGGATGGVRGVASAAAAALLRSLSAWAGSLARNLDLLAGDEEHARRAAAARRRPPQSLMAGLVLGITNFAINILGAVGGLAHHPLLGVVVGETDSGAAALRRGLLGALTKPLSATADLVAYAGHGLLSQTGWDPIPQPRRTWAAIEERSSSSWRRDCVRWAFRLAELTPLTGFEVLLDTAPLQLLLTHKFLVVADPDSERIVEMIDLKFCTLGPHHGQIIELCITQRRQSKQNEVKAVDEDDEYQISAAAMARVALYTGATSAVVAAGAAETRVLTLLTSPGREHALRAALAAALHHNSDTHFPLL